METGRMNVDIGDVMKRATSVEVRVVGMKKLKIRLWLVKMLFKFAGFIGPFGSIKVNESEEDEI